MSFVVLVLVHLMPGLAVEDRSVLPLYKACRFARFFNFIDVFFRSRLAPRQHRRPGVLLHATSYHKAC